MTTTNHWFSIAWRLFKHETRRGELTIITLAIALSVAAVLSLSMFSERLQSALTERIAEAATADKELWSRKPIESDWKQFAESLGLQTAQKIQLNSMLFAGDEMVLVEAHAVDAAFPLKGQHLLARSPFGEQFSSTESPGTGEVWLASRVFQLLDIELGDMVDLGEINLKATGVIVETADKSEGFFANNPVVLMNIDDIQGSDLIGPYARVGYALYFVGDKSQFETFDEWLIPKLNSELHDYNDPKDYDWLQGNIGRAEQYFLLASLLAIVLAAVSIAVAAQRYSQRHYDPVAVMKTLGANQSQVRRIYLLQVLLVAMSGVVIGTVAGYTIQQVVGTAISSQVDIALDGWHWRPFIIAVVTGIFCAVLFSIYPLLKLFSVPPLRVLRKDIAPKPVSTVINFISAASAIFLLMYLYSNNLKISAILFVSGILLIVVLVFATLGMIRVGRKLASGSIHQGLSGAWHLAWARIQRRAMGNAIQLISFAITILLLLIVLVLRNDMLEQWRGQLPENTPNYFLANITEAELPQLIDHFAESDIHPEHFYPIVRGRMTAVNDETVQTDVTKEDDDVESNQRRGLGREANLTWRNDLPFENEIVEGQWWQAGDDNTVSLEKRVAERMDIKLNDMLTFVIGSEQVIVRVSSIREVNWQTLQPNFFMILNPNALKGFSPTYITSFNLPRERKSELNQLIRPFPTVSLIDVDARIDQIRSIIDQVSAAVEFILVLVLCAGSLVLIAQVQSSLEDRQQELAILRTLGAKASLIRNSVVFEFVIVGVIAGTMAAIINELALYLLQTQIFQMSYQIHLEFWLLAPAVGAFVVAILGALSCWKLLRVNNMKLLREVM